MLSRIYEEYLKDPLNRIWHEKMLLNIPESVKELVDEWPFGTVVVYEMEKFVVVGYVPDGTVSVIPEELFLQYLNEGPTAEVILSGLTAFCSQCLSNGTVHRLS